MLSYIFYITFCTGNHMPFLQYFFISQVSYVTLQVQHETVEGKRGNSSMEGDNPVKLENEVTPLRTRTDSENIDNINNTVQCIEQDLDIRFKLTLLGLNCVF